MYVLNFNIRKNVLLKYGIEKNIYRGNTNKTCHIWRENQTILFHNDFQKETFKVVK